MTTFLRRTMTMPSGAVTQWLTATAPDGWLVCNGDAVSRTTYAELFAVISTDYGVGDGSTTFNVPDFRGAFLRGAGSHGSETMADGNPFAGPSLNNAEDDQGQGHIHLAGIGAINTNLGVYGATTDDIAGLATTSISAAGVAPTTQHETSGSKTDGTNGTPRTGDETRPFNYGINFIIKV